MRRYAIPLAIAAALLAPVAVAQPAAPQPILSAVQTDKLSKLLARYGADATIDPQVIAALGLAPSAQPRVFHQLTVIGNPVSRAYHLVAEDGGYLIMAVSQTSARTYRADARQQLVAAVDKVTAQAPTPIPRAEAQGELKAEFAYWAAIADRF